MKEGQTTDELLVKRFNAGDARAMDEIYNLYFKHLYYFARRITPKCARKRKILLWLPYRSCSAVAPIFEHGQDQGLPVHNRKEQMLKYIDATKRHRASEQELGTLQDEKDDYILCPNGTQRIPHGSIPRN